MNGWKKIRISDIGQIITGNTPPRKQPELYGDHTIFVKPTDMNIGERYCYEPEESYSDLGYKKYKNSLIPQGATCVVTIGSIGQKMILAHQDLFINQAVNAVIPSDQFDKLFVFYLLKLNLFQLKTFDSGTASGRENVSKSSFSAIEVSIPTSQAIQSKIGAVLSAYDDLIENNLKRIKLLEEMAQITYEDWFVRMKFPGHETAAFEEATGLPEGWFSGSVTDICQVNKDTVTAKNAPDKIKYIDIACAYTGGYESPEELEFSEAPSRARRRVKFGDTIFSTVRPNRKTYSIILDDETNLVASSGFAALRPKTENTFSFVYLTVANQDFVDGAVSVAGGAAYPAVKQSDFEKIKITVPSSNVIRDFSSKVNCHFEAISSLKKQNLLLTEARDILLPRLMTGMIDIEQVELPEAMLQRLELQEAEMAEA
ncbi:restriction endonuclease subunit S [Pseudoalteromonas sp. SWYJZ12]|uniref:restriction endonuclease subunit S n=1 Tax=Pseudoalteromonas sp. SWYJZ12 TaxID=2792067 RepID=UPI0018CE3F37|nr:restriction endonuclease subunit S [Pseudoalteromonas sp. SWYJZ12]MBH0002883.1 restriction endonuclease subunit S [Pseudoalteromonas sp. SWYJZ12]